VATTPLAASREQYRYGADAGSVHSDYQVIGQAEHTQKDLPGVQDSRPDGGKVVKILREAPRDAGSVQKSCTLSWLMVY